MQVGAVPLMPSTHKLVEDRFGAVARRHAFGRRRKGTIARVVAAAASRRC
jgi:hypothetical protein